MTKFLILTLFFFSIIKFGYSQNIPRLIIISEKMDSCGSIGKYQEQIEFANILIKEAPVDSELYLLGYSYKSFAENKLGDFRGAILSASKALNLTTKVALMIRQPDLPELLVKLKSTLYLVRSFAKESIGLTESSKADLVKAAEVHK